MKSGPAGHSSGRVLVVEDERDVAELLRYNLGKEGYDVVVAATGAEAVRQAHEARPDLVLLDIMVPQLNGWEICRRLKQDTETRAIPVIMVTGRVDMKGRIVSLTPREFDVLALLAASPGRVFARDELLDAVWGRDGFVEPRTVDVHVARLRRKFAAARVAAPGVETVRGVGYRFHDAAS